MAKERSDKGVPREANNHTYRLSEEEIGFLDKAARTILSYQELNPNIKVPVGEFGIVRDNGEVVTYSWVNSSLARKIKQDAPAPQSQWMKYQFESMFAGWHQETANADTAI